MSALALIPLWIAVALASAATLLCDLIALPWVLLGRSSPADSDAAPRSTNASIVIVTWNGLHFLRDLLPSLQRALQAAPGDHEVIVVDNGSEDGTGETLSRDYPWVQLVLLDDNQHFIRGVRKGLESASREILVLLNNDMRVEEDFLSQLLRRFGDPRLFAITSRIEMQEPRTETGLTRGTFKRGSLRQEQVLPERVADPSHALWAGGGSSAFDRRKFEQIGGFEELYYPCYAEDLSASWLAWAQGWHVDYAHDSVVHHHQRGTTEKVFGAAGVERLDHRNRELFFWRAVTDPLLALEHGLFAPWNAWKDRRRVPVPDQCAAAWAVLPRLPHALRLRQSVRRRRLRSDRQIITAANGSSAESPAATS